MCHQIIGCVLCSSHHIHAQLVPQMLSAVDCQQPDQSIIEPIHCTISMLHNFLYKAIQHTK